MKTLEPGNIYTFKLTTGEEIVARFVSQNTTDAYMTIENPILAALTSKGLQLMPSLFSADPDAQVKLNSACWAMISDVREDVKNSWIQATTGIQTVSKQILTG